MVISDFETYLLAQCHYSKNYTVGLMKKFRHIIELALNREWIYRNPFKEHKLQWQKSDRGYLTQTEIETLMEAQFDDQQLEISRDVFIFYAFNISINSGTSGFTVKALSKNIFDNLNE